MKFAFEQLQELDSVEVPAHIKRAFIPWLRRNVTQIPHLSMVPLEEEPGSAQSPEALNATWTFRNRINQSRLLINAMVGPFAAKDLLRLQLRCVDADTELGFAIATEFDGDIQSKVKRCNDEEDYSITAIKVGFYSIGDAAFAPSFISEVSPKGLNELSAGSETFRALETGRWFDDARSLRRAFWRYVRRLGQDWDKSTDDVGYRNRYRPLATPGLLLGQRVSFGQLTVWIAHDSTPGGESVFNRLLAQHDEVIAKLGCRLEPGLLAFHKRYPGPMHGEEDFDDAAKWLKSESDQYAMLVNDIVGKVG
jgi:hypothetical protein